MPIPAQGDTIERSNIYNTKGFVMLDPYGMKRDPLERAARDISRLASPSASTSALIARAVVLAVFFIAFGVVYYTGADADLQEYFNLDLTVPLK